MNDASIRKLQAIPVRTEICSGNVAPLLHQIRHCLRQLHDSGVTAQLDLKSIPLAPGELDKILAFLGDGEVRAEFESLGRSELRESAYPGVWIVTHFDELAEVKALFIEVTYVPQILQSQPEDVLDAVTRLERRLAM
jgi:hydrogenase-1 operon protein HyaF